MDELKQVIVMRKDLGMRKGKMIAQACHGSIKAYAEALGRNPSETKRWMNHLSKKICVSVNSEEELLAVHQQALDAGLPCALIRDAGLTEFNGVPTLTCCVIGPVKSSEIDKITGNLSLL